MRTAKAYASGEGIGDSCMSTRPGKRGFGLCEQSSSEADLGVVVRICIGLLGTDTPRFAWWLRTFHESKCVLSKTPYTLMNTGNENSVRRSVLWTPT